MKIGIVYDDVIRDGLDCQYPNMGNPGVGGTQYCFLMLLYYLPLYYKDIKIIVFRYKKNAVSVKMPNQHLIEYRNFDSIEECIKASGLEKVDLVLFSAAHVQEMSVLLHKYNVKGIVWVHNWIRGTDLRITADCKNIKRVVFLGKEHYDRYIDDSIIKKAVVIPNMFNTDGYPIRDNLLKNIVTYTGSIVPSKGFHILAKSWKKILKKIPDAELYVLGNSNIYGGSVKLGDLNIAEKNYEDSFKKYITDESGKLLSSVHLMGIVGKEKIEIYKKTKVGVVNPSGRTEVCPISALEMEAAGIPIVSKKINGLPDVVINDCTGILFTSEYQLTNAIVGLLQNQEMNNKFSKQARIYIKDNFNPKYICRKWYDLFEDVKNNGKVPVIRVSGNYSNNFKWLRIVNYKLKQHYIFKGLPSVIAIEGDVRKILLGKPHGK